jgi:hypothetical protein
VEVVDTATSRTVTLVTPYRSFSRNRLYALNRDNSNSGSGYRQYSYDTIDDQNVVI